jgi:hypothetical protein
VEVEGLGEDRGVVRCGVVHGMSSLVKGIGVICGTLDRGYGEGADYIGETRPIGTCSAEGCPIGERTNRFLDVTRAARSPPGQAGHFKSHRRPRRQHDRLRAPANDRNQACPARTHDYSCRRLLQPVLHRHDLKLGPTQFSAPQHTTPHRPHFSLGCS